MATPKKYFHDRIILLLLSIDAFLALAGGAFILLRVKLDPSVTYAIQYRERLGIRAFTKGSYIEIVSFAIFSVAVLLFHFYLSKKAYPIRRHFSILILGMGVLLLALSIIVSNALLVY